MTDWYKTKHRRIILDFHTPEWPENVFKNINPEKIVKTFYNSGINAAYFCAKCQHGNCYYNTKIGHKHNALGERDLLKEFLYYSKKYDISSVIYFTTTLSEYDVINYKDYIEIKPGEIIKTWMNFEVIDNFQ